jgi:hypothetical protein
MKNGMYNMPLTKQMCIRPDGYAKAGLSNPRQLPHDGVLCSLSERF